MGRGRAKAKQTKVARDLKYNSPSMDLDRLKADLGADGPTTRDTTEDDGPFEDDDEYEDYSAYRDEEDEEDGAPRR